MKIAIDHEKCVMTIDGVWHLGQSRLSNPPCSECSLYKLCSQSTNRGYGTLCSDFENFDCISVNNFTEGTLITVTKDDIVSLSGCTNIEFVDEN